MKFLSSILEAIGGTLHLTKSKIEDASLWRLSDELVEDEVGGFGGLECARTWSCSPRIAIRFPSRVL